MQHEGQSSNPNPAKAVPVRVGIAGSPESETGSLGQIHELSQSGLVSPKFSERPSFSKEIEEPSKMTPCQLWASPPTCEHQYRQTHSSLYRHTRPRTDTLAPIQTHAPTYQKTRQTLWLLCKDEVAFWTCVVVTRRVDGF